MSTSRRVDALALVLALAAAASCTGATAPPDSAALGGGVEFQPVANIDQVMDAIVIPRSDEIFEAAVYENGVLVTSPETLEAWAELEFAALALAESGNLLLMPPRLRDADGWVARSHELTDASMEVLQAARAQDVDQLLEAGGVVYAACVNCHDAYVPPDVP